MLTLKCSEKDAIIIHTLFTLLCGIVILLFRHLPVGQRLLFLVIVYNLAMPTWGLFRKDTDWINLWLFCFILSMFQVFSGLVFICPAQYSGISGRRVFQVRHSVRVYGRAVDHPDVCHYLYRQPGT